MDIIKTGTQLLDTIKLCYHANQPLLLVGSHGIAKSAQAKQAAAALDIGYLNRDLSLMEPTDLIGLPMIKDHRTAYAPPAFLPTSGDGLLMLEELNRCERHMLAPCLQLMTERQLNDYMLPPGWLPIAAVNPGDDGGYDVNELDLAMLSRFVVVRVEPGHAEWLAWAKDSQIHEEVIRYVASDESVFDHPGSNPRSWAYVSNLLYASERCGTPASVLRTVILGAVGLDCGVRFMAALKNEARPLTAAEVINAYPMHFKQLQAWVKEGRLDLVESTLRAVLKYLQPLEEYRGVADDKKQWQNLRVFLYDLPGDLREKAKASFDDRDYAFPQRPRLKKKGQAA